MALASRLVALACHLGEVAVTTLKLASDYRTASVTASGSLHEEVFERDVAFTALSGLLSIAMFVVSTLGVRNVLRAMRDTARHLSSRTAAAITSYTSRLSSHRKPPTPHTTNAVHPVGGSEAEIEQRDGCALDREHASDERARKP